MNTLDDAHLAIAQHWDRLDHETRVHLMVEHPELYFAIARIARHTQVKAER